MGRSGWNCFSQSISLRALPISRSSWRSLFLIISPIWAAILAVIVPILHIRKSQMLSRGDIAYEVRSVGTREAGTDCRHDMVVSGSDICDQGAEHIEGLLRVFPSASATIFISSVSLPARASSISPISSPASTDM